MDKSTRKRLEAMATSSVVGGDVKAALAEIDRLTLEVACEQAAYETLQATFQREAKEVARLRNCLSDLLLGAAIAYGHANGYKQGYADYLFDGIFGEARAALQPPAPAEVPSHG